MAFPPSVDRRPGDTAILGPSESPPGDGGRMSPFVNDLLDRSVVLPEEWEELDPAVRSEVLAAPTQHAALDRLVALHLLTPFQADTVRDGAVASLTLGQYRVLGLLGRGGMGVVYRAEHVHLRRDVAVKVFVNSDDTCPRLLRRFHAEARAAARLHHPNLIACLDAGRNPPQEQGGVARDYYVMELVNGQDLDALVRDHPLMPVPRVCDLFRQVAEGLAEAHRHGLIHRDIKPSNIIVTPDWKAKLLDFGLALHPYRRMTEPGTVLGTIGYMAPEQARDPHAVDARADLFSLGASMYWALTGRDPFPDTGSLIRDLQARVTAPPLLVEQIRPELPEDLCALVNQLLSTDPAARPASARVVALALAGLCRWAAPAADNPAAPEAGSKPNVVIVEDDAPLRNLLRRSLGEGFSVAEAGDGEALRELLHRQRVDLVALDVNLPGVSGDQLIESIRGNAPDDARPMILLMSGVVPPESLGGMLEIGADDFLSKPFTPVEFRSRIRGLLVRKPGKQTPTPGTVDLGDTPPPVPGRRTSGPGAASRIRTIAGLFAQMSHEVLAFDHGYGERLERYVRALATAVPETGEYARLKDARFVDLLAAVAPLHDVGMIAVPPAIRQKPGALDEHERAVMQMHPVLGAEWMTATGELSPTEVSGLSLAAEVIRGHHERWDGGGYPDGLKAAEIPLAARVVGLISVYDVLRSRRPFRPALAHTAVIKKLVTESVGQFDPTLLAAMEQVAPQFEKISVS